ncbi:MAG TPA: hypothetical protein VGV59_21330 [Pyrinomonadaceae bacterium]|nr:hypothetical protein [Pyrinomonadaceae bacterium]
MADYRDRLDEWREAARRKARELDEKYNIRERVEEGARVAGDAARRGAEKVSEASERARTEAERLGENFDLREHADEVRERTQEMREQARRAAEQAARAARGAGETFRTAGRSATDKAGEVFDGAKRYYDRASNLYDVGARATRLTSATTVGLFRALDWARENPKRAIMVSLSLAGGIRLGAAFPGFDAIFLGAHPHWFTHSALPVWALRRAGTAFDNYLQRREALIAEGELTEAERQRVEFERKIVRYVGAPLLGAFSFAAGAAICAQIFQPGPIVGAPVSWLLGGNPVLEAIWLFGNGVVCFQQGYKFFMIALRDQQDAQRIVREIKGLLPAAATA